MPDDAGLHLAKVPARPPRRARRVAPEQVRETEAGFDEAAYVAAFPDVAHAVRRGEIASALEHYRLAGRLERRLERPEYRRHVDGLARQCEADPLPPVALNGGPAVSLEARPFRRPAAVFIAGWADDRQAALTAVEAQLRTADSAGRGRAFPGCAAPMSRRRCPRRAPTITDSGCSAPDLRRATPRRSPAWNACLELRFADGSSHRCCDGRPAICTDADLRDMAMGYLAGAAYHGNRVAQRPSPISTGMSATH